MKKSKKKIYIIGGGIIGVSTAMQLSNIGYGVVLIEKEQKLSQHQTGNNSGVIHAGPYYSPGSLKALMCKQGNDSMYAFAEEYGIEHKRTGKLIVAKNDYELNGLAKIEERALANGVRFARLTSDEALNIEPNICVSEALHIKDSGIINYTEVVDKMAEIATNNGAIFLLGEKVLDIESKDSGSVIKTSKGEYFADFLINCAGLYSDKIASLAGVESDVKIVPFRGEYYELDSSKENLVNSLVYPVPDPNFPFLGVHLTKMIDGSVHLGPNAVFALGRESYSWSNINIAETFESVTFPGFVKLVMKNFKPGMKEMARSLSKSSFVKSVQELLPQVEGIDMHKSNSGIRAQALLRNGKLVDDFHIEKIKNQVHVLNSPSPAATSSVEIGKYISDLVVNLSA